MRLEGFVTVGRGELLLSLLAVALLMCALGYLLAQVVMMARRPKPSKLLPLTPADERFAEIALRQMCKGPHCDDTKQMDAWLRGKNFSLITNEMLHEMKQRAEFAHKRADAAEARQTFTSVDLTAYTKAWLAQQKARPTPTDADQSARAETQWPGGDPDGV